MDEPPTVTGATNPTVRENSTAVATYRASDPERVTRTFTWFLDGDDAGAFTISERGVLTFDPAPNFEARADRNRDNIYEVTVRANDGSKTGELDVEVTVEDVDEPPEISGTASFTISEAGSKFVGSYGATDPEGTDVSWETLAGPDARYFAFDELSGALSFKDTPDYEARTNKVYRVTVRASDEGNKVGNLPVTVVVTDVNEPPEITGPESITVNEGHTGIVATYAQRDPEGRATNWGAVGRATTLTGPDASLFEFDRWTGRFAFSEAPDYERGVARYQLTLNANDGSLNSTLDVTVTVTNLEEPGTLVLSSTQPHIGNLLTATLEDGDRVQAVAWTWERSRSRSSGWTEIGGVSAGGYYPVDDDGDHYLRVTADYTDGYGSGKRLQAVSSSTTQPDRATDTVPLFPGVVDDKEVREDARAGTSVGSPLRATDEDNDPLTYSLDVSGAGSDPPFVIDRRTGQIRVADGVKLDYETQRTYSVRATATDSFNAGATVSFSIVVTDVKEAPEAVDDAGTTDEDEPVLIDVRANDSDPDTDTFNLTVSVRSRPHDGTATVDPLSGKITYTAQADYYGADTFVYTVSDGVLTDEAVVSVTVRSLNDAPTFPATTAERSVSEKAQAGDPVGAPVTATDVDGDTLSYSLSGSFDFEIEEHTARLTVRDGAVLDSANQPIHTVIVTAEDGRGGRASIEVTITVTTGPVRPPVVTGGGGGGGGSSGPSPSKVDFEWTVTRDIEGSTVATTRPLAPGQTVRRCGSRTTRMAPATASTPTTSERANGARISSSSSTSATALPAASGRTARRRGSPTVARTASSPTTSPRVSASLSATSNSRRATATPGPSGPTTKPCSCWTAARMPSSPTISPPATSSLSTPSTTPTTTRAASGRTALPSGSPTTAPSGSSPTASRTGNSSATATRSSRS